MAKKNTILVQLVSTALNKNGKLTGTKYIKKRNPKKQTEKMQFNKYDAKAVTDSNGKKREDGKAGMHVLFVEKKLPNPKAN